MSPQSKQNRQGAEHDLREAILCYKSQLSSISWESDGPETPSVCQNSVDLADLLHDAMLRYTNAANMLIVTHVLQLPQELRDQIYMHLWRVDGKHDPSRSLVYWWDSFDEPWFSAHETPFMNLRPPHFIDKSFVGPNFAKEALKQFKNAVGKDLRPISDKNPIAECGLLDTSMEDFVRKDVFGIGVTVEELVRNLDLRVNFQCDALTHDEFAEIQKSKVHDQRSLVADTALYTREDYLRDLNDGVTALLSIPPTSRVITHDESSRHIQTRARVVTLAIRQEDDFIVRDPSPILKLVARTYHGLRAKGSTVKVQYYSEEIELNVLFEDDAWEWTDDDWKKNRIAKNKFGRGHSTSAEMYVWEQLREHLFQKPDEDVLPPVIGDCTQVIPIRTNTRQKHP